MGTKPIVCAVDFSDDSKAALGVAADIAKERGGPLIVVHVDPEPPYDYNGGVFNRADAAGEIQVAARQALVPWKRDAEARGVAEVQAVSRMGVPWDEIVQLARDSAAELVVVGTHGATGLERALIGSVAEKVVRHAPCSVMVVRQAA